MNEHVTIWRARDNRTVTYTDLSEGEALNLVDMVRSADMFLVADASPAIGHRVPVPYRTTWYTRDLPEES